MREDIHNLACKARHMHSIRLILLLCLSALSGMPMAQGFSVSGIVTDAQGGQALTGASVFCQNTTLGTQTAASVCNCRTEVTTW